MERGGGAEKAKIETSANAWTKKSHFSQQEMLQLSKVLSFSSPE